MLSTWSSLGRSWGERPLLEAIREFRRLLQTFAEKHGAQGLYDETITCF